jgi:hypothetical protein
MKSLYRGYLKITAIVWGGCLAVFLLVFILVIKPQGKLRIDTESKYNDIKIQVEDAITFSQEKNRERLIKQVADMNSLLGDFLFRPVDAGNLAFEISRISSNIGLVGFGISGTGNERLSLYDGCQYLYTRRIQVSFTAGFNKFAAFVNALEKHRPVIFINSFSISRSQQENATGKVDMELAVLIGKDKQV